MNSTVLKDLVDKALARAITFPEIIAALKAQEVESYHVDLLRREYRFYDRGGRSQVMVVPLIHDGVAPGFSVERLESINRRVQAGQAGYPDFVREGAAAGCAYYIVYLEGRKVRYFGRDGEESIQYFPGSAPASAAAPAARSRTKSVDIDAPVAKVFAFLADPLNWPQYAVVNLRTVTHGEDGWCKAMTKFGEGEIKVQPVRELGILDHIWRDSQATWRVNCRAVPNGAGATVMMTFFQPPVMSDARFDAAMAELDIELSTLRDILEKPATAPL
jgi:uncharacterized protein YbcV (DUF1398 family)